MLKIVKDEDKQEQKKDATKKIIMNINTKQAKQVQKTYRIKKTVQH